MFFRSMTPLLWVLGCLLLSGCGPSIPKGVVVKGKVVKAGQPMQVQRRDIGLGMVELHLVPKQGDAEGIERALATEDGSFTFAGPGKGVKPGEYRLAIFHREMGPPGDLLNGAFSDQASPIIVHLAADKVGTTLDLGTIDLDKPPSNLP